MSTHTASEVLTALGGDLAQAFEQRKCRSCACLRDTLQFVREELAETSGEEVETLRTEIGRFLDGLDETKYPCLGCDPCYPAVAENTFHEGAKGVLPLYHVERPGCGFQASIGDDWPVVAGEYIVVDAHAPVALCTLASADLPRQLADLRPRGLAIVGKAETENIGIDKIIKNTISNPNIQFLIVAGEEPKGHRTGETLLALAANGVDQARRVIGSTAKRPHLRNVTAEDIEAFREQVEVIGLIGCSDAERLAQEVADLAEWAADDCCCECSTCGAAVVEASTPHVQAGEPRGAVRLDPAGYFVILPQPETGRIIVEHYGNEDKLVRVIEGATARAICGEIVSLGAVSQLDHAAYLGRELMRAEMSLRGGFPFRQDGA